MQEVNSNLIYYDDLTGFYNRRYLRKKQEELKTFQDCDIPYSIVMFDIDNFKDINDTYGHLTGDNTLKDFSTFLRNSLRAGDSIFRYGGDEFVFLMLNTEKYDAEHLCHRILTRCSKQKFGGLKINLSAGIAAFPEDGNKFDGLLKLADEALYEAKRTGKNRIGNLNKKQLLIPSKVFINRKKEKETLINGLNSTKNSPSVFFIKGNVGIGKTRLIKEVLHSVSGHEILWSNCISFLEEIPYFPIREIVKYKLRRRGKDILKSIPVPYRLEIGKLIPEVLIGLKNIPNLESGEIDGYRLYESIYKVIFKGRLPKVIVVDNLQWIDNASIAFFTYLLRTLKNTDIKFIFIYRQEEENDVIKDFSSYISRESAIQEITLEPLVSAQTKQLLKSFIGDLPSNEMIRYIKTETGGNPFFIEELTQELYNRDYLRLRADKWFFNEPVTEIIPKSIQDIIIRKYENLGEKHQEILNIASVLGYFDLEIVLELTGLSEEDMIICFEDIYNLGLIEEINRKVVFREEITRGAIYEAKLNLIHRRILHKKLGRKLEEKFKENLTSVIEQLAFHYYNANDEKKGVYYSLKAGEKARNHGAISEVIKYYAWADELLGNSI